MTDELKDELEIDDKEIDEPEHYECNLVVDGQLSLEKVKKPLLTEANKKGNDVTIVVTF